jgi:hypothetical protein
MIRYDIYSNTASSDHGLQHFPVLQELVDNLRLSQLEVRFTRVQQREEGEMNLASAKYGGGVKVKGTAVKMMSPETHIKGLLGWVRTVAARVDRGLHVDIEKVRQTNGAPLAMARLQEEGRAVFVSGLDDGAWVRLTAVPDLTGGKIPDALAAHPEAQGEYLTRRVRPGGFYPMIQPLVQLAFLPPPLRERLTKILQTRDNSLIADLSEPTVINLGLISDGLERYQKLLDQFYVMLINADAGGDLPALFEFLTLDIPFPAVMQALDPVLMEGRKGTARDKRVLANDLRISLANSDALARQEFQSALLSLVLGARLAADPLIYLKATRLPRRSADELEALSTPRRMYLALREAVADAARSGSDPAAPLPQSAKQVLFEMTVQITYQAQYQHVFRERAMPTGVAVARDVLAVLVFEHYDVGQLKSLKSNLPARGVAKSLAERTNVTWGEMRKIQESLEQLLFPVASQGQQLAAVIHGQYKDADQQRRTKELNLYLTGGVQVLTFTNYIVSRGALNPLMWQSLIEGGRRFGSTVLASRDEVRSQTGEGQTRAETSTQGYVILMQGNQDTLFPVRTRPELLMHAYRRMYSGRVARAVRHFLAQKANYLHEKYGPLLFEVIHHHLLWNDHLRLSQKQVAQILIESRMFDKERLREFGFRAEDAAQGAGEENPWLSYNPDLAEGQPHPFTPESLEKAYRSAYGGLVALLKEYEKAPPPAEPGAAASCAAALGRLASQDSLFYWDSPAARQALAACREAQALSALVLQWLQAGKDTLLAKKEQAETIEITLPGPLAYLALLKEGHQVKVDETQISVRLVAAPEGATENLDPISKSFCEALKAATEQPGAELGLALRLLQAHDAAWNRLLQVAAVLFIDQTLRVTLMRAIVPAPPGPKDLMRLPEERVLCLGTSSFDQGKFSKIVARPDRRDVYATLSDMANRMMRLQRLREEMTFYRDLATEVRDLIANFNISAYEAAYMHLYSRALARLDQALSVRPEDMSLDDLAQIQNCAREISKMVREIYEQERTVRLRDRWLSRTIIRLRQIRPNARVNFADVLFDRTPADVKALAEAAAPNDGKPAAEGKTIGEGRSQEFQTFSERVRNAVEFTKWMAPKAVIVISPSNTQQKLVMSLIDQLYRLKGIYLPILVNIAGCDSYVDALLTRIPPHRLFDLNEL